MDTLLNNLQFLRPEWFWAFIPLLLLMALVWRGHVSSRSWRNVVDAQLLPHLLIGEGGKRRPWSLLFIALAGSLGITAMAGPVWEKLEQPVFRQQSALVILMDLSRSMDATDIRPSRLERAKLKVLDILNQRGEGQTALITYAAVPFVVSPLTSDSKTIANQLPSLTTDLMPAQGSRLDRAIKKAGELLQQAGATRGSVLVVTDGVEGISEGALESALNELTKSGHRMMILGVGSASGAPIPKFKGGFFTDSNGAIVMPKLDASALQSLASKGNGIYRGMTTSDADINAFLSLVDGDNNALKAEQVNDMMSDQWREKGALLLLPLMLIAVFAFRRGYLVVLALFVLLPQTEPVYAFEWNSLWSNNEQRAQSKLDAGDAAAAAEMFESPEWRAAAQYRAGDYESSLQTLEGLNSAQADYNRGNALAKMGKLPEAISAYESALEKDPQLEDAQFNRDLVQKALDKQQQQQKGEDGDQQQQGEQGGDSEQQGEQGDNQQQSGDQSQQAGEQGELSDQQQAGSESQDQSQQQENAQSASDAEEGDAQESQDQQVMREGEDAKDAQDETQVAQEQMQLSDQISEEQQATEQWLRRIPDDPGGLWRRKFMYQYQRSQNKAGDEEQAW